MQLAQINLGRLVAPTEDPRVAQFMDSLDRINALGKPCGGVRTMMAIIADFANSSMAILAIAAVF